MRSVTHTLPLRAKSSRRRSRLPVQLRQPHRFELGKAEVECVAHDLGLEPLASDARIASHDGEHHQLVRRIVHA